FKGFLFYALDFEKLSNTGNVNVTVVQAGGISLDAVQPLIEGEFKQLGASKITFRHATVRGVDSLVVDYLLTLKSPGGSRAMTARAYFIPNADVLYNVTTTCYGTTPQTCIADGDAMAQGMTVTR
ncbi:MAG TPA: hypothetical protein VIR16_04700, partial [Candidatus Limnocylindrales bacterium]